MFTLRSFGASAVATVTELRGKTTKLLRQLDEGTVVVQRNNEPVGILVHPDDYAAMRADAKKANPAKWGA